MIENEACLHPSWPTPPNIGSIVTTRRGGVSSAPFNSQNLALHVGEEASRVQENRARLEGLTGQSRWCWLQQSHGIDVTEVTIIDEKASYQVRADASTTANANVVCVVLTADCLPVLLCDKQGKRVAAVHAGWRGLANGVLLNALSYFPLRSDMLAYLGPAIGPKHFEVGPEVKDAFSKLAAKYKQEQSIEPMFTPSAYRPGHYYADLYGLAKLQLQHLGVKDIYGGEYCTYSDEEKFYSFRRDGVTGRFASAIWIKT